MNSNDNQKNANDEIQIKFPRLSNNNSNNISSIKIEEHSEDKKGTNSFYEKIIVDELNKIEKLSVLNGW